MPCARCGAARSSSPRCSRVSARPTAAVVFYSPHARIIPVVLGVFGYTYGSLLGVFLLGLTTKNRGNDFGNVIGMICGFIGVAILSGLPWDLINAARGQSFDIGPGIIDLAHAGVLVFKEGYVQAPDWIVQIEFSLAGDVRDDHHLCRRSVLRAAGAG